MTFSEDRAEIRRRDGAIATTLEIVVSPEHDAEVRRVSIMNLGARTREIELTSYAELVLAPPAADAAHPAFSNLFVQTECVADLGALLATRRPRSHGEPPIWAAHVVVAEGQTVGEMEYETDRGRFLGRGRGIRTPMSVIDGRPLSNTAGSVLDPIYQPQAVSTACAGSVARGSSSRRSSRQSRDRRSRSPTNINNPATFERPVTLAWTQAQVQLRHLGIDVDEAHLFQDLASRILYSDATLRPSAAVLAGNVRGPSGTVGPRDFRRSAYRPGSHRRR